MPAEQINNLRAFNAEGERIYTDEQMATVKRQDRRHIERIPQNACSRTGMDMEELRGNSCTRLGENLSRRRRCSHFGEDHRQRRKSPCTAEHRFARWPENPHGRIKKILGEQPMSPPELKEIEKQLAVSRNKLTEVIRLLSGTGPYSSGDGSHYLSSTVDQVRAVLKKFPTRARLLPDHFAILSAPAASTRFPLNISTVRGSPSESRCPAPQVWLLAGNNTTASWLSRPRSLLVRDDQSPKCHSELEENLFVLTLSRF